MATLDDINDVVAAFLVAAVEALELTDVGAPSRLYTNSGRPAMDCCGQCVVWSQFLGDADTLNPPGGLGPSVRQKKVGAVPVLTVFVQATRCAPVPKTEGSKITLPSPAALAETSRMTNQDIWALWNHINEELRVGALSKICKGAWRDGATSVEGQGGCVGWELVYRYPIEGGYPFTLET